MIMIKFKLTMKFLTVFKKMLPLVPLGVWVGITMARKIEPDLFYKFVYAGMFLTGLKLLWDALR